VPQVSSTESDEVESESNAPVPDGNATDVGGDERSRVVMRRAPGESSSSKVSWNSDEDSGCWDD